MENHEVGAIYSYKYGDKEAHLLMDVSVGANPIVGSSLYTFMNWKSGEYIRVSEGLVDTLFERIPTEGLIESIEFDWSDTKLYVIEFKGDDSIFLTKKLNKEEYDFLFNISRELNDRAEDSSMPTMNITEIVGDRVEIEQSDYSSNEYSIEVSGCDDSTSIREELTDEEYLLLSRIAENITNASEYGCMPTMNIRKVD